MNFSRPRALLFDLDGLLLDTEALAREIFIQACNQVGWERVDLEIYSRCIGHQGIAIEQILKEGYGDDFPFNEINSRFQTIFLDQIEHQPVDIKPGAIDLLSYAQVHAIPCAIATSSRRQTAKYKLNHNELYKYFSAVVSVDDVKKSKPNPEPYRLAARLIGENPEMCWALEDSPTGVRSAVAAGCQVFQVPDLVQPTSELRALGHEIVESLYVVLATLQEQS